MPELPEAETIVRGLREHVVGQQIRRVAVPHADILRESRARFAGKTRGRIIDDVTRRGKNVVMQLDAGRVLAVNLGMTGSLLPSARCNDAVGRARHVAVRLSFASGETLVFNDTRRFGTVECLTDTEWAERSARMGPEPLEGTFTAGVLGAGLSRSRSPIRSWLLDQRKVAGLGNIYANEALYFAGVHPQRPARSLEVREVKGLHRAIRRVLRAAIRAGGTTIRDFRAADGGRGEYATWLRVYGRHGQLCEACSSEIRRIVFGNRSAFYCPTCQRRGGPAG